MTRFISLLIVLLATTSLFTSTALANDARAEEVLKQARTAAGGEDQLQKVQTLNITGQYRRMFGERQMAGDREISIQLPNKYLVEDSSSMGGMSVAMVNTRGLNGEQAWNANSGGGGMVIRMGGPGGQQATPEQMEAAFRRQYRTQFARYMIAMMLTPPDSFPLEYKYAGESDVDDTKAEVLDVTGPDKFAARVYFDKESHLPLLISYRARKPRMITMSRPASGAATATDATKAVEDAKKKLETENPPIPEEVDFFIRLSDHKKVNGVTLPYKLTFLTESEVSEEFEVKKYQVNPQFKADKFEKH
jgi:hypothetical protein